MMPVTPLYTSLAVQTTAVAIGLALARLFHRRALATRVGRVACLLVVVTVALSHAAWAVGPRHYTTSYWGVQVAMTTLPLLALFVASLVPAAALRAILARAWRERPAPTIPRRDAGDAAEPNVAAPTPRAPAFLTRRNVLAASASVAPAVALGLGTAGFQAGAADPRVRTIKMPFVGLPASLHGLRVLQLSDLHLGCTRNVDDVERALERAGRVDLIVFTGDVAEEVSLLGPVLRTALGARPRHGVFACLGNHEYLREIRATRPLYEKSGVDLLVDDARSVRVGGARLSLLGVDDPISLHAPIDAFLATRLDRALERAAPADARLLLAHRPEAFAAAAKRGVDLVLSGHTHGGQIGFNGKSAFQRVWPERYLWGEAARGRSRLYTTSGFGHWYPFRLGCPSEAPVIELVSVPAIA